MILCFIGGLSMRVEEVINKDGQERYILTNSEGEIVLPVAKFIKYKDNTGSARNTLRRYCYNLKLFFEFLEQKDMEYTEVGIDSMGEFVRWLKNPYQQVKVTSINKKNENIKKNVRSSRTINFVLSSVINFYDYLMKHEDYSITLSERLKKQISGNRSSFKGFLHHISKKQSTEVNELKQKVPKTSPKVLSKQQIETLIEACTNIRDKFLLYLLYESGMRIGEVLSLHLSDIVPGSRKIHIVDRGELVNGAEIKTVGSPRTIDCSQELINLYSDYIPECHTEEVDTNFVFIKLSGKEMYKPMTYTTVNGVFKALKKKTGIHFTPHMFRHTSLTELWKTGEMRPETLQKRAGHKHVQTTMDIYVNIDEEDVRKDWEQSRKKNRLEDIITNE